MNWQNPSCSGCWNPFDEMEKAFYHGQIKNDSDLPAVGEAFSVDFVSLGQWRYEVDAYFFAWTGIATSPGAVAGKVVFHAEDAAELGKQGEKVVLVRLETSPED